MPPQLVAGGPRVLLRRLREIMAERQSAQARLDKLVSVIAANMVAEVCSIYLRRAGGELELFATEGLNREAVHRTRLKQGEGLVGLVAQFGGTFEPVERAGAPGLLLPAGNRRRPVPFIPCGADRARRARVRRPHRAEPHRAPLRRGRRGSARHHRHGAGGGRGARHARRSCRDRRSRTLADTTRRTSPARASPRVSSSVRCSCTTRASRSIA